MVRSYAGGTRRAQSSRATYSKSTDGGTTWTAQCRQHGRSGYHNLGHRQIATNNTINRTVRRDSRKRDIQGAALPRRFRLSSAQAIQSDTLPRHWKFSITITPARVVTLNWSKAVRRTTWEYVFNKVLIRGEQRNTDTGDYDAGMYKTCRCCRMQKQRIKFALRTAEPPFSNESIQ